MVERSPDDVTLFTLHEDLTAVHEDLKAGFADLKATLVIGFAGLPTRESGEEMVRLLRDSNRLQEERFTQLDLRIREQHLETQQVLHAVAEGQRILIEGQRILIEGQHGLIEGQRVLVDEVRRLTAEIQNLSADIKALVARLDALIKGRGDGSPTALALPGRPRRLLSGDQAPVLPGRRADDLQPGLLAHRRHVKARGSGEVLLARPWTARLVGEFGLR